MIESRSIRSLVVIAALMLCIGAFATPSWLDTFTPSSPDIATQRSAGSFGSALPQTPDIEPMRVGGDYLESKLIKRVDPAYPEPAKRINAQGTVRPPGYCQRGGRGEQCENHWRWPSPSSACGLGRRQAVGVLPDVPQWPSCVSRGRRRGAIPAPHPAYPRGGWRFERSKAASCICRRIKR